jgi:hypothetical protein
MWRFCLLELRPAVRLVAQAAEPKGNHNVQEK